MPPTTYAVSVAPLSFHDSSSNEAMSLRLSGLPHQPNLPCHSRGFATTLRGLVRDCLFAGVQVHTLDETTVSPKGHVLCRHTAEQARREAVNDEVLLLRSFPSEAQGTVCCLNP